MKTTKTITRYKSTYIIFGFFLSCFLFSNSLYAQKITIKGTVKGKTIDKTTTLTGANIFLKGTNTGTSTNKKGVFTFPKKLNIGDTLEVSFLGFITKKIKIDNNSTFLNIVLEEDYNEMLGALNSNKPYKSKKQKQ